jgi:hypothetical protein
MSDLRTSRSRGRLPTGDGGIGGAVVQECDDRRGRVVGIAQQMASRVALALLEGLQNERFLFRPHAAQGANASVGRRALEIVEGPDVELAIQRRDGLGSDSLEVKEIENGRRKLGDELTMVRRAAGVGDFADARGEVLADARNVTQFGRLERRQLMGVIGDDWRRSDARILNGLSVLISVVRRSPGMRDREVIQAAVLPSRRGIRWARSAGGQPAIARRLGRTSRKGSHRLLRRTPGGSRPALTRRQSSRRSSAS